MWFQFLLLFWPLRETHQPRIFNWCASLMVFSLGGHSVPKGTRVLVNMWAIHHDPKHWEEADTFRPGESFICSTLHMFWWLCIIINTFVFFTYTERFLDSSGKRMTPASFLPFGAGPRVCVGESLARMELFLFASRLLQRFHFSVPSGSPLPDLQGRYGVVLQPQRYTVRVTPRYWQTHKYKSLLDTTVHELLLKWRDAPYCDV